MSTEGKVERIGLGETTAWRERRSTQQRLWLALVYLILTGGLFLILIPLGWMISTSFKTLEQSLAFPPVWIPNPIVPIWDNLAPALEFQPMYRYLWNTTVIVTMAVVGTLLSSSLVAFGFARLRAPGSNALFLILLSTIMLPYVVTMIPQYVLFRAFGWVNTFFPLIVPAWFGGSAFNIFLLRQFFLTIPIEMDEAARIDGASYYQIFWNLILPLSKPALAAVAIFSFYGHWNEFLTAVIYLQHDEFHTIAQGLAGLTNTRAIPDLNSIMAWTLVCALPCVIVFFISQRYFIQGVVITGVKG
jgi:ABC-type glycerol-3-phosphate transport system permease component